MSDKLNMTWDEITERNYFWFRHKVDFVNFTIKQENQKIKIQQMKRGR